VRFLPLVLQLADRHAGIAGGEGETQRAIDLEPGRVAEGFQCAAAASSSSRPISRAGEVVNDISRTMDMEVQPSSRIDHGSSGLTHQWVLMQIFPLAAR